MANELGHLGASVSLNIDPFQRSIKTLEAQQRALKASMKGIDSSYKGTGSSVQSLSLKQKLLTAQTRSQAEIVRRLKQDYDQKAAALKANGSATEKEIQEVARAEQKYSTASAKLNSMNQALSANEKALRLQSSSFYQNGAKWDAFGQKVKATGDKITSVGKGMSMKFSLPVAAGFTLAAKNAISFSSEIQKMSALLDDGNVSSGELKKQLDSLGEASKKWSMKYGISTSAINEGMEEIIKKGYTYEQTLGAMPSIMDASVASGEDFNTVMNASTSILEQFGLKVDDTEGTLKNTQRVTDSLTFVANKTAAGFSDMGLAMEYVGPVAHGLGMSLEETSAAIGLMSNNGIEGEKAGTALRGALSKLMKPSDANAAGFKKMGINVEDFKKGTLGLPTILDKIKNNTKGWTKESKASAIALAFGVEAQSGMNVLVNQGGDALRNLTKDTKNATGYTKGLADTMNNTSQNKVKRFKESLHVLSITVGEKLLPTLTPLIEKGTEIVKSFSEMDESTQKTIIKWIALGAAAGPALTILGSFTRNAGTLISVVGKTGKRIGLLGATLSKTTPAAKLAEGGLKGVGAGAVGASGSIGTFTSLLNPATLGIAGVGLALAGGYAAWKIWGEKVWDSAQRTKRWGTDVSEQTDQTLQKVQNLKTQATGDFDILASGIDTSSGNVVKSFEKIGNSLKNDINNRIKETKEALEDLPDYAEAPVEETLEKEIKKQQKTLKSIEENNKKVLSIKKNAKEKERDITAVEVKKIEKIEMDSLDKYLNAVVKNKDDRKKIQEAMNTDSRNASKEQAETMLKDLAKQREAFLIDGEEKRKALKDSLEKQWGEGSDIVVKSMKAFDDAQKNALTPFEHKMGDLIKKYPELAEQIDVQNGRIILSNNEYADSAVNTNKEIAKSFGTSSDEIDNKSAKVKKNLKLLSKDTSKASEAWDNMIIDDKTAEVRDNLPEFLTNMANTDDGWKQIQFAAKEANLSTDAKEVLADAVTSSERWNKLTYEEKALYVKTPEAGDVANLYKQLGKWDLLNPAEKDLIINAKNKEDLSKALVETGQWNELPDTMKKNIDAKLYGLDQLKDGIQQLDWWNRVPAENKKTILEAKTTNDFKAALDDLDDWDSIPAELRKKIIAKMDGVEGLKEAVKQLEWWNNVPEENKNVLLEAKSTTEFRQALENLDDWDQIPDELKKRFKLEDEDFTKKVAEDNILLEKFDSFNPDPIRFLAENSDLLNKVRAGEEKVILFNGQQVDLKKLYGDNKNLVDSIADGSEAVLKYNQKVAKRKELTANNRDIMAALNSGGNAIVTYNNKKVSLKKLLGNNKDVISKLNKGKDVLVEYNGKKVSLKKLFGDNQNLLSKLSNGKITISDYNKNFNPSTKTLSLVTDSLDGVTGRISEIDRTWSNFRPQGKDLTISALMKTPGMAKLGTNYHKGGPVIVNDAQGSNYRELITTPSGLSFIPEGRNVTLDLPKGSSVLRGDKTASLLKNMPKYAKGVGDFKDTNFMRVFESLIGSFSSEKGNNVFQAELTIPFDSNELKKQTEIIEKNNKKQDLIINLLNQLVLKDPTVTAKAIISEREIGEAANRHLGKQYRTIPGMNNF